MKKGVKQSVFWILLVLIGIAIVGYCTRPRKLISPIPEGYWPERLIVVKQVQAVDRNLIDGYVDDASLKFGKGKEGYSNLKKTLHCLLYFESKHGWVKNHGDNGYAGGIMQFWTDTWNRMRKQMLKQGLISDISTRYNEKEAIYTTAWAIVNGYGREWGPILRKDCQ